MDTRAPRPTDLVALVTFDEEVRENLAVTRERLQLAKSAPTPLAAAIAQWLHLGRRTWVSIAGRQIRGIATARELAAKHAWEIDTLIEADDAHSSDVLEDLLRQACVAAQDAQVTHLLLRTPEDSAPAEAAPRAGFAVVQSERLWSGRLAAASSEPNGVRDWTDDDTFASFQLYCRATPISARQSMAMTVDEWHATRDQHWQDRGDGAFAVEHEGRLVGTARTARSTGQFTLVVEPEATGAADALVAGIARSLGDCDRQIALVGAAGATEDAALRRAGLEPSAEAYVLFCKRLLHPVKEETYARAGIPITGG
ncbi:MAG: hypothetical protein DWI58_18945 [Chloroflexi bacterium]|nr:MAG: hypothetical protein DWI58_18945 [Chloroflexota bacterium]